MPINKQKLFKYIPGLWVMMMILSSCATLSGCKESCDHILDKSSWNYQSFVMIKMEVTIKPDRCEGPMAGTKECSDIISMLPPKNVEASGSGMVVRSMPYSTFIITAEHVCRPESEDSFVFPSQTGNIPIVVKKTVKMITIDFFGNHREAEYYSSDTKNDICLIRTRGKWGIPVKISETYPEIGDKVINAAAPMGIFNPGMVPLFEGQYLGSDSSQRHFYSVPARPGSSGSVLMNSRGEIVGVIHSAFRGLEHMAISSSLSAVKDLITTIDDPDYR